MHIDLFFLLWKKFVDTDFSIFVAYDVDNEYIRFNGDRSYGKIRYPYLTTNRKQFYIGWGVQRVHVFTKSNYI
jgi:hypothetical protein